MCTNCRFVYNRYTRQSVLVKCGKCPACQQEKATARANRIRNQVSYGTKCLFVTLTYDNNSVPYIWRSDAITRKRLLPVYRDVFTRRNRSGKSYKFIDSRKYVTQLLDNIYVGDYPDDYSPDSLRDLNKKYGRIGVCYYPDLQNFLKRLRINLQRKLPSNYDLKLSYYACSEYGGTSQRPHFHLLIFIPSDFEQLVRSAIVESWPFGDKYRTRKYVELARDAASYVASYVNSNNRLSSLLETNHFKQKHSYSKNFGCMLDAFQLGSILQQADGRTLLYTKEIVRNGVRSLSDFPIPKYVINRYFPKFKGYSRTSSDSLSLLGVRPQAVCHEHDQYLENNGYYSLFFSPRTAFIKSLGKDITYYVNEVPDVNSDYHKFMVRQQHAVDYYCRVTGKTKFDYQIDFQRIWNLYESQKLLLSYQQELEKQDDAWKQYYDNIGIYIESLEDCNTIFTNSDHNIFGVHRGKNIAPTLSYIPINEFNLDPNTNRERLEHTFRLTDVYNKLCKQKDVTNAIMVQQGHFV